MKTKTYRYIINGRVQGVSFRYYTLRSAREHLISGTVKNLYNGDVDVYAQGDEENIKRFESFLHAGPPSAVVKKVIKEELETTDKYYGFEIIF